MGSDAGMSLRTALGAIDDARTIEVATALAAIPAPLGEEGPLAEAVAGLLDRPGIDVHLQAVVPGRPNVIATVRGSGSGPGGGAPALILNAHLDAAWAPGGRRDPYRAEVEGNRLYAGGITDMKGPLAAMIVAVEAAAAQGGLGGDLVLHAVIAHNPTGLGTKYAVATEPARPTGQAFGIVGQGSSLELHTENSGAVKFEIELQGRAAHVSFQEEGVDALAAARLVADALASPSFAFTGRPTDRLPAFPKFVVGELIAGGRAGVPALLPGSGLADRAVLRGDVRTVPGMDRHTVTADLEALVAATAPNGRRLGRPDHLGRPPVRRPPRVAVDLRALGCARGGSGRAARARHQPSATRLRHRRARLRGARHPVRRLRPGPWRYEPDEYIELDELLDAARIYFATALLLGG